MERDPDERVGGGVLARRELRQVARLAARLRLLLGPPRRVQLVRARRGFVPEGAVADQLVEGADGHSVAAQTVEQRAQRRARHLLGRERAIAVVPPPVRADDRLLELRGVLCELAPHLRADAHGRRVYRRLA